MGLFDSPSHLLIVLVVLVLLFGSAKLPKLARSLGESMRIFKGETQKMHGEDAGADKTSVQGPAAQQPAQQLPAQASTVTQQPQDGTTASAPAPEAPRTNQPG